MRILLLGATGRTGKLVLEKAIENDFEVNCLVRNPEKISAIKNLNVFKGDVRNESDLLNAMEGCDYIINVLNVSRTSDFPWSKLRTPPTLLSDTMQLLVKTGKKKNIKKVIVCSAWGVAETREDIPFWFRWLIDFSNIGIAYKNHEKQEEILKNSDLDYTIVRPVGLINSDKTQSVKETFNNSPKPTLIISRKALAEYMIESITNQELTRKTVTVSKK